MIFSLSQDTVSQARTVFALSECERWSFPTEVEKDHIQEVYYKVWDMLGTINAHKISQASQRTITKVSIGQMSRNKPRSKQKLTNKG